MLVLSALTGCPADPEVFGPGEGAAPVASNSEQEPEPELPPEGGENGRIERKPGDPFPLPDPLPPEAQPHAPKSAPAPQSGPAPLDFWLGGTGEKDGQFSYPRCMVTTPDGTLFVADKTGRIQKWSADGKLLLVVRTPGVMQGKPTGLGLDARGDLLVADTHYCRVLIYSPDLKLKHAYGAPGRKPGRFMLITSIQAGAGGLHYTTDFQDDVARVQVFKEDGTHVRSWGTFGTGDTQFRRPMNLAVDDANDRLYVADAVNHRICVYTRKGKLLRHLGGRGKEPGKLEFPYDVKLDAQGRLWVAEFGNQRVSVLNAETGACLGTWGGPGRDVGGLNRPWAVALGPNRRVWVLDSMGDRLYALKQAAIVQ